MAPQRRLRSGALCPGIDIGKSVQRGVPLRDECGETRSRKAVRAGVAIEREDQFTQAEGRGGKDRRLAGWSP
jgi:hypothetical protein